MKRRDFLTQSALAAVSLTAVRDARAFPGPAERTGPSRRIIVIGAGLAGLSAAHELTRAGHDVVVLEARNRPGGRVQTLRDGFADGLYADAGATRVPDHHHFTIAYARDFGLTLDPFEPPDLPSVYYARGQRFVVTPGAEVAWPFDLTAEERALGLAGMRRKYVWSMLGELGDVREAAWPSREIVEEYDRMNRSDFWRSRGASPAAIELLSLGGIDDRADTWSTLFMLRNQALNLDLKSYSRIRGGTDLLPKAFAARLADKIHYGAPVVRIEHGARGVKAIFRSAGSLQTITGDHLICAVPFSVQRDIEVFPPFTVEKQRAIEELPYLSASKIFLQSKTRFWRDAGWSGFATTDLPINSTWDMTYGQPGKRGILQAFPISLHSRQVTAMAENERIEFALAQVAAIFPGMRDNFEGGVTKCWDEDPWARGVSSYYKPGQFGSLLPHVARAEGRVHFAGEHTSPWIDGWMQGALESGNRVAREINAAT